MINTFGCRAYAKIPDAIRRKLDWKAEPCRYLGIAAIQKGYVVLMDSGKISVVRDLQGFQEDKMDMLKDANEPDEVIINAKEIRVAPLFKTMMMQTIALSMEAQTIMTETMTVTEIKTTKWIKNKKRIMKVMILMLKRLGQPMNMLVNGPLKPDPADKHEDRDIIMKSSVIWLISRHVTMILHPPVMKLSMIDFLKNGSKRWSKKWTRWKRTTPEV